MARPIVEDGSGLVREVFPLNPDPQNLLTAQLFATIRALVTSIVSRLNGKLSLGTGADAHRAGNLDAQYRKVTSHSTANTEFLVDHGLGRIPIGYDVISRSAAGVVYDSQKTTWSTSVIKLKCTVVSVELVLRIY